MQPMPGYRRTCSCLFAPPHLKEVSEAGCVKKFPSLMVLRLAWCLFSWSCNHVVDAVPMVFAEAPHFAAFVGLMRPVCGTPELLV